MNWWLAVFYSTMLAAPATNYSFPQTWVNVAQYHNTWNLTPSTAAASNALFSMDEPAITDIPFPPTKNRLFKVTEQTITVIRGEVVGITTKFGANPQWLITSNSMEYSTYSYLGSIYQSFTREDTYAVDTESIAVVNYARGKATRDRQRFTVFRGEEYSFNFTINPGLKVKPIQ